MKIRNNFVRKISAKRVSNLWKLNFKVKHFRALFELRHKLLTYRFHIAFLWPTDKYNKKKEKFPLDFNEWLMYTEMIKKNVKSFSSTFS